MASSRVRSLSTLPASNLPTNLSGMTVELRKRGAPAITAITCRASSTVNTTGTERIKETPLSGFTPWLACVIGDFCTSESPLILLPTEDAFKGHSQPPSPRLRGEPEPGSLCVDTDGTNCHESSGSEKWCRRGATVRIFRLLKRLSVAAGFLHQALR